MRCEHIVCNIKPNTTITLLHFIHYNLTDFFNFFLADWLLTCNRANPNMDNCFQRLFEHTFPYLAKGVYMCR